MSFYSIKKLKAGIEISADQIRSALIFKKGNAFTIKKLSDFELVPGIIKPSFKVENIVDIKAFKKYLEKACKGSQFNKVAVALPDTSVKVLIKKFSELPGEDHEIREMIKWDISSSLNLSSSELRVSWENMGENNDGSSVFIIALGMEEVIGQYEKAFRSIGVSPAVLSPAGLSQFNFYSRQIPEHGHVAYLAMFDDFVNIFVFFDGSPIFYKTIKKGMLGGSSDSALNDVDLLIQYYHTEHPDVDIERFYIASPIKLESQMEEVLHDFGDIDFEILEERQLIGFDKKFELHPENRPLPFYTSVIGTAQGG